jgi:acyl carrier protein
MDVRTPIRKFILKLFLSGGAPETLKDDESFLERGIIDSTGVLELVAFLEETFHLKVDDGKSPHAA